MEFFEIDLANDFLAIYYEHETSPGVCNNWTTGGKDFKFKAASGHCQVTKNITKTNLKTVNTAVKQMK